MAAQLTLYLYVEGDEILRPSFQIFFQEFRLALQQRRCGFRVVMYDGNSTTHSAWRKQRSIEQGRDLHLLLVDSEGPVSASDETVPDGCQSFLTSEDLATGDVFFMTQIMESWFLTEPSLLQALYGKDFKRSALPGIPKARNPTLAGEALEAVTKHAVLTGLKLATRDTPKGEYESSQGKTTVAPAMLEKLNTRGIAELSYHLRRLLQRLESAA